jgi:hypothetical protein
MNDMTWRGERPDPNDGMTWQENVGSQIMADAIDKMHAAGLSRSESEQMLVDFAEIAVETRGKEL